MDIRLFFRVLRRFKFVAALGLVVATALAFLSFVKVDQHGLRYRSQETWLSTARVLIAPEAKVPLESVPNATGLATLYASLMSSDTVRAAANRLHRIPGGLSADPSFDKNTQATLPILYISAVSTSPRNAAVLANDGVTALNHFIASQQNTTNVPPTQRIHLEYLNVASPLAATVSSPRSKTRPIMVFILGLAATMGLVLILENLRPRLREVRDEVDRAA
jgi:capsular polysaccharide biosynthesis protein